MRASFAVVALGVLMVVAPVAAQSPSPEPVRLQTVCLRILAPTFTDAAMLIRLISDGTARIVGTVPCEDPYMTGQTVPSPTSEPEATPEPTATPAPTEWHRTGQYRYRWLRGSYPRLQVIADNGCTSGLRVVATDDYDDSYDGSYDGRVRASRRVTVDFFEDDSLVEPEDVAKVTIRCAPTPWTRTYSGGGSDDRFVTIPANDSIRARFTVRAPSSYGCITSVYVDGESVDEFDLFYDGRQTKTRTGWVDASGRTHLKVISSCPWTLRLTGYR